MIIADFQQIMLDCMYLLNFENNNFGTTQMKRTVIDECKNISIKCFDNSGFIKKFLLLRGLVLAISITMV